MQRFSAASFDLERIAHLIAGRPCDDCLKRHPHDFIKPEWSGQREKLPSAERQFSMNFGMYNLLLCRFEGPPSSQCSAFQLHPLILSA